MEDIDRIIRQSWARYIRQNAVKIFFSIIIVVLLLLSISLSGEIDIEDQFPSKEPDVQYTTLFIVSSCAFLLLLTGVLKTFILDNAESLGLKLEGEYRTIQTLTFILLTMFFISCIYFLLDVALQEAFLQLGPVLVFYFFLDELALDIPGLTDKMGGEFYQTARNILFEAILFFIIAYLIFAMVMILTRNARRKISDRLSEETEDQEDNPTVYKILVFIFIPPLIFFLLSLVEGEDNLIIFGIIAIFIIITSLWWLYQLIQVIIGVLWRGVKITPFLTSVNFLLLIPPLLAFWFLPVFASTILIIMSELSETNNELSIDMIVSTFSNEILNFPNIILFDFIIFAGIATIIIGFAEGMSLLSILKAIKNGVGVSRTGQPSTEQAPKIALISQYLIYLVVWFGVSLSGLRAIWESLRNIQLDMPEFPFPGMLEWLTESIVGPLRTYFETQFPALVTIVIPLVSLIIPIYFILSTSFKFLSISIITPRIKNLDYFIVLVSATFVLIIMQILGDLWLLEIQNAPLRLLYEGEFFNTITILRTIEGLCFYLGFLAIFFVIFRRRKSDKTSNEI
ncbi:MAG: hypothetical protein JSV04_04680 [Candidatus Heimdallarchaeota archaeon]|nr:MAG: hypothetical protein JSV04_04680 [Candidatus Heimdallarchaeota archaeon]